MRGPLWASNLAMLCSQLRTPHPPQVKGGVLSLEDINEHPYRVDRMPLQPLQAGVLGAQKAIVLGDFGGRSTSPSDRGYDLEASEAHLPGRTKVPVLTGRPFGHIRT